MATLAAEGLAGALMARGGYNRSQADELAEAMVSSHRPPDVGAIEVVDWIFAIEHPTNLFEFREWLGTQAPSREPLAAVKRGRARQIVLFAEEEGEECQPRKSRSR